MKLAGLKLAPAIPFPGAINGAEWAPSINSEQTEKVLSTRHVRKWVIAAPIIGFLTAGCSGSGTPLGGVGGNAGNAPASDGPDAGLGGGTGGIGGTGGTGGGVSNAAGTGGTTASAGGAGGSSATVPDIDYEPVGLGDPWFFGSASELDAFEVGLEGATGAATWSEPGEIHLPLTFTAAGNKAFIHVTAPWDSVAGALSPVDLTHRVLRAKLRVASGAVATGGVQAYSQSSLAWTWVSGEWNDFADLGTWHDVEFDFDTAAFPTEVLRFGLQVYANSPGTAEIILDDLRLEPKPEEPEADAGVPGEGGDAGVEPPSEETDAGDAGAADSGAGLGYEPAGIGDPWFFDAEDQLSAFEFAVGGGASETHAWSNGEVHITATIPSSGATVAMQFGTPWNGTTNEADLSGRVLRSRIRIEGGATADGGVQLFTQSGGWSWVASDWMGASSFGSFTDVALPLSSSTDASSVQRFGMQFYGTSPGTIEIVIDDLRLEPAN